MPRRRCRYRHAVRRPGARPLGALRADGEPGRLVLALASTAPTASSASRRRDRPPRLAATTTAAPDAVENITEGVAATLAEAIDRDAGHLVLVSSAMVYGASANNPVPLTEDAILRPDVEFVYARQLAAAEAMADRWRRQRPGRTVAVLRPVVTMAADGTSSARRRARRRARPALRRGRPAGAVPPPRRPRRRPSPSPSARRLDGVFNVAARRLDRRGAGAGAVRASRPDPAARTPRGGARRAALALPARADPARPAQLHPRPWVVANDRLKAPAGDRRSPTSRPTSRAPRTSGGR